MASNSGNDLSDSLKHHIANSALSDMQNMSLTDVGSSNKKKPQDVGWAAQVPVNYAQLSASRDETETLIKQGEVPSWQSTAVKYEWSDEYGEVGPEDPHLEKQLFGDDSVGKPGGGFGAVINVHVELDNPVDPVRTFNDAGLHPIMTENLKKCQFDQPTPIQAYCIPAVLSGMEVIGIAQTGSGKTAAYLVPILSKLMGKAKKLAAPKPNARNFDEKANGVVAEPLVLIIVPTRELAAQIYTVARRLCYRSMLRPCTVYGGAPVKVQRNDLARGCDILIGTAGRLNDFVVNMRVVNLRRLKYIILDEADELIKSDWEDKLRPLLHGGASSDSADLRFLMFSATFNKTARELAESYLGDDRMTIRVGRPGATHRGIQQEVILVLQENKKKCLEDLLWGTPPCKTVIFANSSQTVEQIDDHLYNADYPCSAITSSRTQREREDALRLFAEERTPILITSDVVARGIDIPGIMHVINYDLPSSMHGGIESYVHRIGRTGRIGHPGLATSFYNDRNSDIAIPLVKTLIENGQSVPDFLEEFKPADINNLNFDEDADDSAVVTEDQGRSDPWGASDSNVGGENDTWGVSESAPAGAHSGDDDGWGNQENTAGSWENTAPADRSRHAGAARNTEVSALAW